MLFAAVIEWSSMGPLWNRGVGGGGLEGTVEWTLMWPNAKARRTRGGSGEQQTIFDCQ